MIKVTLYLEVISSWCYWGQPAWEALQREYRSRVAFDWKIALMDSSGLPVSREQCDWFYRRSGTIVRSPFMLHSGWFEPGLSAYEAANFLCEAARALGVTDDRVWMAMAHAALREGRRVADWDVAAEIAAAASGLETGSLLEAARGGAVAERCRATTAEFHGFGINQRPAWVFESSIGDRAIFSGIVDVAALRATMEAMLADMAAYESHAAHWGEPPTA
jgi:predicted DsbA family dithiol-disulfide isomerase